jgi:nucleoid-associated protein YgaU
VNEKEWGSMKLRLAVVLLLLAALAAASGCARVERSADPTTGDYYTEEEYQKLSKAQRAAYCAALAAEAERQQACADRSRGDLEREAAAIRDLEGEMSRLQPRHESLAMQVASLESEIAYYEGLPRTYVVRRGDYLTKISGLEDIYLDPLKWRRIYRANRAVIGSDPNLIHPDQELAVPRDWPASVEVKPGDNLWKIAGYWEVYGDRRLWERIYEANRDQLRDPNMLTVGQVLAIPR